MMVACKQRSPSRRLVREESGQTGIDNLRTIITDPAKAMELGMNVVMTFVGDKIVYRRDGFKPTVIGTQ